MSKPLDESCLSTGTTEDAAESNRNELPPETCPKSRFVGKINIGVVRNQWLGVVCYITLGTQKSHHFMFTMVVALLGTQKEPGT